MTKYSKIALCALVLGAFTFTSCSNDNDDNPAPESIYKRLGTLQHNVSYRHPGIGHSAERTWKSTASRAMCLPQGVQP